ncbi:hypothetical protein M5K25_022966 [Dendrobium thyrsiflorum]|uniref:Uncharacterized protein n=1 Tax=Dendrobium thyrsiflorum TaxID=117978 RepID=A0ABD0U729_DENTH
MERGTKRRERKKGPKQEREGINEEKEESSLATKLLLDHRRTSAQPPTDVELLPGHRLTSDFYLVSNYCWTSTRQRSFRPPSPTDYGHSDRLHKLRTFRPLSPDKVLFDLRRPPTMVFPISVARRLRSFRPPLPTTVLPTSVAKQQSFEPLFLAEYGLFGLLRQLRFFQPSSPDNDLSDLRRLQTMVL